MKLARTLRSRRKLLHRLVLGEVLAPAGEGPLAPAGEGPLAPAGEGRLGLAPTAVRDRGPGVPNKRERRDG